MTRQKVAVKQSTRRFGFIGETIDELKKVVWLTRQETIYLTALVLIITIAVAAVLGVIDYGFSRLINNVFLGG